MPPAEIVPLRVVPDQLAGQARLDALLAGFLAGYGRNTRDAYQRDLREWVAFCERLDVDPLRAERPHVQLYARWLEEGCGRAASTVARRLSSVAGLYRYALEEGWIDRSPSAHVRRPRVSDESPRTGLDKDEFERLLAAAEEAGPLEHALVCLLGLNGMRVSEACAIDVGDLDHERWHTVVHIVGKGGKRAVVPLAPRTAAAVADVVGARDVGPVLPGRQGNRLTRQAAWSIIERLARRAGVKAISPHSLRHTFVTLALDAGVSLRDVQDAARHADPRTTRRYDRARNNLDRHATYKLAAYVA